MTPKILYTVTEARDALGCTMSKSLIYKLLRQEEIPYVQIGNRKLITGAWIEKILREAQNSGGDNR